MVFELAGQPVWFVSAWIFSLVSNCYDGRGRGKKRESSGGGSGSDGGVMSNSQEYCLELKKRRKPTWTVQRSYGIWKTIWEFSI